MAFSRGAVLAVIAIVTACSDDVTPSEPDVGKPCKTSSDCATGFCIGPNGGAPDSRTIGFCTAPCESDASCVPGWFCRQGAREKLCQCQVAIEICDRRDNDCNGIVDDAPNDICACEKTACDGRCVDTDVDPKNCGGCGLRCPAEATCEGGLCKCPGGRDACLSSCTDIMTDSENCGTCGRKCSFGTGCAGGECRCGGIESGDLCEFTQPSMGKRTFCRADAKCSTSQYVASSFCFGGGSVVIASAHGGVAVGCAMAQGNITLVTNGESGIGCGTGSRVATDGVRAITVAESMLGTLSISTCGKEPKTGTFPQDLTAVDSIGIGVGFAYWASEGKLYRCPDTGCPGAPAEIGPLVGSSELVVDGSGVYARAGNAILHVDPSTGVSTPVGDVPGVTAMFIDGNRLLLTTDAGILACAKSGCGSMPATILAQPGVSNVSADGVRIWWRAGTSVFACAEDAPCTQPTVVLDKLGASAFGADDANLYLLSSSVERIPK